jgi:hypothetical protein
MDPGDLIFYGVIVVSVVSSILKAVKKQPGQKVENTAMPDFKGSRPADIIKTILEEMVEKDDDYLPSNPKPVQPRPVIAKVSGTKPTILPMERQNLSDSLEKIRTSTESHPRKESFNALSSVVTEGKPEDTYDPILEKLDLRNMDELKKAIIYSEIIHPKF